MARYTKFTMKWKNRCHMCGKTLDVGAIGYGTKDDMSGQWKFLCTTCHDSPKEKNAWDSNAVNKNQKDGDFEALLNTLEGPEGTTEAQAKDAIDEAINRPPTVLEVLKQNAIYGGA